MSTLMEVKSKKTKEKKQRKGLFAFIGDLKQELKKVHWTSKEELLSATKTIVIATFTFGIGIYIVDLMIKSLLEFVKWVVTLIFG